MKTTIRLVAALGLGISPALAQTEIPKDTPPTSATGPGTLSQKLDQTDGVIRPRTDVDPGITKPAPVPNPGSTPVIPPPGSPGGNPSVQPK